MLKKPANGGTPAIAQRADQERPEGDRHLGAQAAHLADVLLAAHAVDHAAGAEEQQRLEEGVRHQVEDRRRERADADGEEHVAELADGRVGEHLLDVVLHEADGRREQRRERADRRHHVQAPSAPGRRGSSAARSCRRRPSPWSRRGSAPRPASGRPSRPAARRRAESAPTCRSRRRTAATRSAVATAGEIASACARDLGEARASARPSRRGSRTAGRRRAGSRRRRSRLTMNAFLPASAFAFFVVPEADQQVGAEPDALPADEQQRQDVAEHQDQHREHEQVQVGEEARRILRRASM